VKQVSIYSALKETSSRYNRIWFSGIPQWRRKQAWNYWLTNVLKRFGNVCEGNLEEWLQHDVWHLAVHYMTCTHHQRCFRIKNGKDETGGDDILLNYMSGGSPTQSHYNHIGGCHQEKPTQTNRQTWSTCQTQIPWTDLVHESLSNLWHVIKVQKKIFWIINGLQLTYAVTIALTRAFCPVCLIHSCYLTVSQDGCTKF